MRAPATIPLTLAPAASPASSQPAARPFHVMIKAIGSACNLDCTYCYYLHKAKLLGQTGSPRMTDAMLEAHVRQYIAAQPGAQVIFSWQGGEPTLLGLEFFRKAVSLQRQYARPGQRIDNDLQTNGTLLNDEWCRFLKAENFLVGLSIDGPRELHDAYRVSKNGKPSFDQVMAGIKLLRRYDVPFNTLTVVNRLNARHPREVYRFLRRKLDSKHIQFIPCVEPKAFATVAPQLWDTAKLPIIGTPQSRPGHSGSVVTDWTVDPHDWGTFLCTIWDEWYSRDVGKVMVNLFETMVAQTMDMPSQICVFSQTCGNGMAMEHDGSLYACDHYVYPEYRLGRIPADDEAAMAGSLQQLRFGQAKRDALPQACRRCSYLKLCWGECPKSRFLKTRDGETGLNYLCPGLKQFFGHIQTDLHAIVRRIRPV